MRAPDWILIACVISYGIIVCADEAPTVTGIENVCNLPVKSGPCKAAFRKYFFNSKTGSCTKFLYGGCHGNGNNFQTKDECMRTCLQSSVESENEPI